LDYGRQILTLPGSPLDPAMSGNNQLLFEGAQMIRNKKDLISLLN